MSSTPQQHDEYQQHHEQANENQPDQNYDQNYDQNDNYGQHYDTAAQNIQNDQEMDQIDENTPRTTRLQELNNMFYLRYYCGHKDDRFGHEFIEFELSGDGTLRYANSSSYKRDRLIKKQVKLGQEFFNWLKDEVIKTNIINADDSSWPEENAIGRQEFELKLNGEHVFFVTCKIGSNAELRSHNCDNSLEIFYHLTHDLKQWFLDTMGLHFRLL
jgi:protein mago nashi